jgi:hypothetical protein
LQTLAVFLVSTVAVLLATEVVLRSAGVHFPAVGRAEGDRALWRYDAVKGWDHRPGSTGRSFLGGPDRGDVRINNLGLRGRELEPPKPPGVRRVLMFGDSFVFGVGVDEPHLLSTLLQRRLDVSGSGPFQVVNMGISGYSTDQQYLLLQERGMELEPDIVVLIACDNDFSGNTVDFAYGRYYKPYYAHDEEGELQLRNTPVPRLDRLQRLKLGMAQHSRVWNAVRSRTSTNKKLAGALASLQVGRPKPSGEDAVSLTASLVLEFRDLVERADGRFVLLNTGHRGEQTPLFHALRRRLRPEGVLFLGLEGILEEARQRLPDEPWDFGRDAHWNVAAHELASRAVHGLLAARGLLEPPVRHCPAGDASNRDGAPPEEC